MNPDSILSDIKEKFYTHVPLDVSSLLIDQTIACFYDFLKLPEEIRMHMHSKIASQHRRGELGLVQRKPELNEYNDNKYFFHYHPHLLEEYKEFIDENSVISDFLAHTEEIWQKGAETAKKILTSLESRFPGIYDKVFDTEKPHLVLRLLHYECDDRQEYIAKPHFDAGSCTLAIAASSPGLRIGSNPNDLQEIEHFPETAIFMLASNSKALLDTEEYLPGWHDVIAVDKERTGGATTRWAIVLFIEGHSIEARPRNETHKWQASGGVLPIQDRV